jgi:hypothetical protein
MKTSCLLKTRKPDRLIGSWYNLPMRKLIHGQNVLTPIASLLVNYSPRQEANPMRVSLFAGFVSLATFACVIVSTQAPMTAQSVSGRTDP